MAKSEKVYVKLLEGKTYTAIQVRKLVYRAYKEGQGGQSTDKWGGRLSVVNTRLTKLSKLFPKLFPEWRTSKKRREAAKKAA
jgi:hypothetical protein